ncbi:hypothetical protein CPLU01_08010 [Colletotrichum plurivorum]|uniref:Uncharacterized protein n=1 Tax=Colletotrichum plurivorum TaxID=2175906 RepID=A0A8H6NDY0_9PEZI|nr:hypothetical protein CPLU01_08010 [Colletotrichum plurivorum]
MELSPEWDTVPSGEEAEGGGGHARQTARQDHETTRDIGYDGAQGRLQGTGSCQARVLGLASAEEGISGGHRRGGGRLEIYEAVMVSTGGPNVACSREKRRSRSDAIATRVRDMGRVFGQRCDGRGTDDEKFRLTRADEDAQGKDEAEDQTESAAGCHGARFDGDVGGNVSPQTIPGRPFVPMCCIGRPLGRTPKNPTVKMLDFCSSGQSKCPATTGSRCRRRWLSV